MKNKIKSFKRIKGYEKQLILFEIKYKLKLKLFSYLTKIFYILQKLFI